MTAVRTTAKASSSLLAALALAPPLAGCGGKQAPDAPTDEVFAGVVAKGTAQDVHCEPVGAKVRGEPVVGCSFEEERNASGAMRAVDRCFVVRDGVLIDVTREVPVGTSCAVSSP
jgi:predicted small lipoprotein YifL